MSMCDLDFEVKIVGAGDCLDVMLALRVQCPLSGEWSSVEVYGAEVLDQLAEAIETVVTQFEEDLEDWSQRV